MSEKTDTAIQSLVYPGITRTALKVFMGILLLFLSLGGSAFTQEIIVSTDDQMGGTVLQVHDSKAENRTVYARAGETVYSTTQHIEIPQATSVRGVSFRAVNDSGVRAEVVLNIRVEHASGGPFYAQTTNYSELRVGPGGTSGFTSAYVRTLSQGEDTGWKTVSLRGSPDYTLDAGIASVYCYATASPMTGSLKVTINPLEARRAGARWHVDEISGWWVTGNTVDGLSVGSHTVEFNSVTGCEKPADRTVNIRVNETTSITAEYDCCSPPSAPSDVSASDGKYTDKVKVTWDSVSGSDIKYRVYRDGKAIGSWQSGTSYNDDDATCVCPDTHSYKVKAKNACGESGYSSMDTGCLDDGGCSPPSAPTGVSASDGAYENKVRVTWNAVSGSGITYRVYRDGSAIGGSWQSATSYDDTGATRECPSTHSYKVKAKNACGESGYSSTNTGCLDDGGCSPPSAPTGVSASDGAYEDKVRVTWNAVSGAGVTYRVYRDGTAIGSWQSGTSYDDTGATRECPATHSYKVKARNSCGESGYSSANTGCLDGGGCPAPSAPTGVSASDGTYKDKVRVRWDPVSGSGMTYKVYRDGTAITGWRSFTLYADYQAAACRREEHCESVGCFGAQDCRYESQPTYHSYKVRAKNSCGESGYSSSNEGHRACAKCADCGFKENVLPGLFANTDSALAVRLSFDEPIDAATVSAIAEGDGWSEEGGAWRATELGDDTDGWVIITPSVEMVPGEVVLVTAGACTFSGTEVEPVSGIFTISAETSAKTLGDEPALLELQEGDVVGSIPQAAASPAYRIAPGGVFAEALTIWIPVDTTSDVENLAIYYFSESPEHQGWYPADQVIGWMVPDSKRVVTEQGQTYIEIQVNHSGIVQLGAHDAPVSRAVDVGVLFGAVMVLTLSGARRAHASRKQR